MKCDTGSAPRDRSALTYELTIIDGHNLVQRLTAEISGAVVQVRNSWPEVRRQPVAYGMRWASNCAVAAVRPARNPNTVAGCFVAIVIIASGFFLAALADHSLSPDDSKGPDIELVEMITPTSAPARIQHQASGIGAGLHGRVGFNKGTGEGAEHRLRDSHGGGGSGKHDILPSPQGRLFQPSEITAPILNPKLRNPALPQAGIDIDPALWKDQVAVSYGDPRSASATPAHGPGEGGNFGSGQGPGIGEGDGPGFGPGSKGNMGGGEKRPGGGEVGGGDGADPDDLDRVLRADKTIQRARVLLKPEPQYTEEARRNQITGTVILRVVFSRTAQVADIRVLQPLPFGLTEKAILAARQIKFLPAVKDNRPVSVYMQLEYNFNLY